MKNFNCIIIIAMLLLCSSISDAQTDNFPATDFKTEKFEDIRLKIENFLGQEKISESEHAREKTESIRQWISEQEYHLDEEGKIFNYHARNFQEFLKLKGSKGSSMMPMGGLWFPKAVTSVAAASGFRTGLGRLNCMALDPVNSNVMYVGSSTGGLWKTTDNGVTWDCITNGIPNLGVKCIAINPSDPDNIFIASGEQNPCFVIGANFLSSIGVLVTYDGGANWLLSDLNFSSGGDDVIYRIRISPVNNSIILATSTEGIHRSVNGGSSWSLVKSSSEGFYDLEFLPGDSICFASEGSNLYRSANNGQSWTLVPSSKFTPGYQAISAGKIELAVTPASSNFIYALYRNTSPGKDSVFLCLTPKTTFTFFYQAEVSSILSYQRGFSDALAVSPTSAPTVYAGDAGVIKSSNSGVVWTPKSSYYAGPASSYVHEDVHDIVCRGSSEVFAITDGGLFKSSNGGDTWSHVGQDINVPEYQGFGGIASDPNFFVGGAWHNAFHKYDAGISYNISCCDQGDAAINPNDKDTIFLIEGFPGAIGLWRTDNGGTTYFPISPWMGCNCQDTLTSSSFRIFQMNPQRPASVYTFYRDFWINYNHGTGAWTKKTTGKTTPAQAFAQAPSDTSRIYAIFGNQVYGTSNYGNTNPWKLLYTHSGPSQKMIEITVNPVNANEFYFVCGGYNDTNKVWKGTWNGSAGSMATVTNYTASLPNVPVYKVVYQNTTTPGIYVGTDLGVFFRPNGGVWVEFNNGLPYTKVTDMEINYPNGLISIATYGRGIWQSPLYDQCPVNYNHGPIILNPPVYGSEYFEASNSITSARIIQGGYGTNVTFNAGNYCQMNVGFEVKAGSEFRAFIDGCTNLFPIQLNGIFAGYVRSENEAHELLNDAKTRLKNDRIVLIPNPANSTTVVFFNLHEESRVELNLYDQQGRLLKKTFDKTLSGDGINSITLDVSNLADGIYFCELKTNNSAQQEKLIVVKK